MTDARLLEAWLRMSADAVRGVEQAKEALRTLGMTVPDPAAVEEWAERWLPGVPTLSGARRGPEAAVPDPRELMDVAERWWLGLGVVPRYRHEEALRRCDDLSRRLEEAQRTIALLRRSLDEGREAEVGAAVRSALDTWDDLTRKALDAQAEWARTWLGAVAPGQAGEEESSPQAAEEGPRRQAEEERGDDR